MNLFSPSAALGASGTVTKASPSDVRCNNKALIFQLLYPTTQLSRAEIGRRTGLSRVAVSDVVSEMIDEGLIRESGLERSSGKGKRGTLLSIDADRLHVLCIEIADSHVLYGAVSNLLGSIIHHAKFTSAPHNTVDADDIARLIEDLRGYADHIIGIGVTVPGVVVDGTVRRSTELEWHNVDLRTPLEQRFGLPVSIDNDSTSGMLAERFFGDGRSDLMFVWARRGIGTALLINDFPISGENHAGGEIGHISTDPQGPPCRCGKRGCLERMIATATLEQRISEHPENRQTILEQAGIHLAKALAMPVGMLDITDICVYGPSHIINDAFINAAQRYLDMTTASSFRERTIIRRCRLDASIALYGEVIAVLRDHLHKP